MRIEMNQPNPLSRRQLLKSSGLESGSLLPDEAIVVIQKLLPPELEARGVDDAASV